MPLSKDYSEINGTVRKQTTHALLFITSNLEGEIVDVWIPTSVIASIHRGEEHDTIVVANWLLRKKGIL